MDILMMAAAIVVAAFIGALVMFSVVFAILLIAMYITSIIRYIFGPDEIDEHGNLRECIGCNAYRYRRDKDLELTELEYCQKRCRAYMRAQKRLRRRTEDDTN